MFLHILAKIRKFKMAAIFGEGKFFGKLARVLYSDTLWVKNFNEIALSRTVKEIEANLCFSIFWQKIKNSKWPPFLGSGNFFEHCQEYVAQVTCRSKISTKSRTVKEIEGNLCFSIFWQKFENSKWPPFLGRGNFLENWQEYFTQIPYGSKISTKSLYLARLRR